MSYYVLHVTLLESDIFSYLSILCSFEIQTTVTETKDCKSGCTKENIFKSFSYTLFP